MKRNKNSWEFYKEVEFRKEESKPYKLELMDTYCTCICDCEYCLS